MVLFPNLKVVTIDLYLEDPISLDRVVTISSCFHDFRAQRRCATLWAQKECFGTMLGGTVVKKA